ncbi:carboxypeptidase regulatory-like domain-containing protein [Halorubrum amylolyticum]|uniref:carboxypeptidase regulatory-like domain-containing protein n=1 Tax=Halorubrum amylolyticum TaxID=2508724 RepID=UPI0010088550|nr:carboxypeptidase regulatory-like domain-containing protein [Halorubrum amylolyticum]
MSRPTTARAQSETVGVVLLLGVFVVAAGAVGIAYLGDVTSGGDDIVVSADLTADGTDLGVSHLGGDALSNDDLAAIVEADGNRTRIAFAPPEGRFGPGDRRTFADALVANASNEVRLVHRPSGTVIERASLAPEPDPTAETGAIEGTVVGQEPTAAVASGAALGLRRSLAPVTGATVTVEGAGRVAETTTAAGGAYRIEGVEPGKYDVTVTAAGFVSATRSVAVGPNETATERFELDPLAPAEFAVTIDGVDTQVDVGEPVEVNATVENVGDEEGTQRIEFTAAGDEVANATLTLSGGESREIPLTWRPGPTDVGEVELAVASEDDTATATVEVVPAETDGFAYIDRDGDGSADETFDGADIEDGEFEGEFDGHFVVFDDPPVRGSFAAETDRITVREGVSLSAGSIELAAEERVSIAEGAVIDTSSSGFLGASSGDIQIESGGGIDARGATVKTTTQALFGADAGDISLSAEGDVDLTNGAFNARAFALFASDGDIEIESDDGTVATTGAWFNPEPTIESDGDDD